MKPKSNTFLLLSGVFGSIVSVLVLLGLVLSMIGLSAVPSIIDQFQESFISPAYGATAGHGTTVFGSDSGYIIELGGVDNLFSDESISFEEMCIRDRYHHANCDVEQCPVCGGQLISCGCDAEYTNDPEPAQDKCCLLYTSRCV